MDVMLERRREPLDAVVEFSIGKSHSLGSHQFYLDRLETHFNLSDSHCFLNILCHIVYLYPYFGLDIESVVLAENGGPSFFLHFCVIGFLRLRSKNFLYFFILKTEKL